MGFSKLHFIDSGMSVGIKGNTAYVGFADSSAMYSVEALLGIAAELLQV